MARGLFRKTSFWKTVGAFRSQWKRSLKRFFLPGYGKKGMGWWRDPKKAAYNWWYHRTSVSLPRLLGYKPSRGACILAMTMACFLNVFAAPVDVAKAATTAHHIKKARKARAAGGSSSARRTSAKRTRGENSQASYNTSTTSSGSPRTNTTTGTSSTQRSGSAAATTSSRSATTHRSSSATPKKTVTNTTPQRTATYIPSEAVKEEPKVTTPISTEKFRLFEPVEPKVIEKPAVTEPDENTPKSTPKNEKDQYIRKRMIIAGSSYCDADILSSLKVGTYFDLEAEPDNPYDKDAVKLVYQGEKIGYIAKQDRLAFVTCLKLKRNIYGVITAIKNEEFPVKYEFETWFDSQK